MNFLLLVLTALSLTAAQPDLNLASRTQPVPQSARFNDPDYYIWCGSMVRGDDAKYHLYYSRWPRKLGHYAWVTHSEIAHAVSDAPTGPFRHVSVVLPVRGKEFWDGLTTHNPTILRVRGRYYLYYMGNTGDGKAMSTLNWTHRNNQRIGVAVSDGPDGPWQRFDKPLLDVSSDSDAPDALMTSNPTVARRPDGGFLMIYKAVGRKRALPFGGPVVHLTATTDSPTGPFQKQLKPIFLAPGIDFPAEDPFAWYDSAAGRYYAVVKDNAGHFTKAGKSLALWESPDGFTWGLAPHPLVSSTEITWADGRKQKVNSLERPQLLFDADGQPAVLLAAVDESPERTHSYNVQIPLGQPKQAASVLALGDSITAGAAFFTNYRPLLAKRLDEAGLPVRFVGSQHTAGEPEGLRHEAYGGKTVEFLADRIDRVLLEYPPDIILLHAGHNHFVEEQPVPGIVKATEKIIETARRLNPSVTVLLSQVIPSAKLPKYSYIPELNRELARVAAQLDKPGQRVVLVDQAAGFDPVTDTVADLVHPNASGAAKMASKWFDALAPLLRAR